MPPIGKTHKLIKRKFKKNKTAVIRDYFTKKDIKLLKEGCHYEVYKKFGAHSKTCKKKRGVYFSVWAPNAKNVSVIGQFNQWQKTAHPLTKNSDLGVWEGFIKGIKKGDLYKYHITAAHRKYNADKTDPFSFRIEQQPCSSSVVSNLSYRWQDQKWMKKRAKHNADNANISIYEMHLGSWRLEGGRFKSYRELAQSLVGYVKKMGFTHVEFLPVMEHPYYGSWGYQPLGFFAPTSRYGNPQDLMYLIDIFHQNDIGVILDWVPSHFPGDKHGLVRFDGTSLYGTGEIHPDWKSYVFNLGRKEVVQFLISSALFWMEKYHIDGLRVDAVASMLYLDYSRQKGDWQPNIFGGCENLEAIAFLRQLNDVIKDKYPGTLVIAEESTAWPKVTGDTAEGGLGFDMKWNMGWMHDTLKYFQRENQDRAKTKSEITHCLSYAFSENFLLPLSHDEVVHEKRSLLGKMPGKNGEKFANLRCLYGYMFAHPGKKLLFMGAEIGQWAEWNHDSNLDWYLLQYKRHRGVQKLIQDLNELYKNEKALSESDFDYKKFKWVNEGNLKNGTISFLRFGQKKKDQILVVCNFKNRYSKRRIGVPLLGQWKEILNTDSKCYDGKGYNNQKVRTKNIECDGYKHSMEINVPPLSAVYYKHV